MKEMNSSEEKRSLKKHLSNGFCGYDWMIDNIISHNSTYRKLNERVTEEN